MKPVTNPGGTLRRPCRISPTAATIKKISRLSRRRQDHHPFEPCHALHRTESTAVPNPLHIEPRWPLRISPNTRLYMWYRRADHIREQKLARLFHHLTILEDQLIRVTRSSGRMYADTTKLTTSPLHQQQASARTFPNWVPLLPARSTAWLLAFVRHRPPMGDRV